ncbi:hypothetical protein CYY_007348 [Polysphondylium violaceum]|uniref:Uncharacterized protein n=1 Tax=Polysphondylium violaceum TaxID=133409 RepID=A0A8J4PNS0_9MYCE|nr:hypothetical protein CYY_007348 [Polysphondylium violaceum]
MKSISTTKKCQFILIFLLLNNIFVSLDARSHYGISNHNNNYINNKIDINNSNQRLNQHKLQQIENAIQLNIIDFVKGLSVEEFKKIGLGIVQGIEEGLNSGKNVSCTDSLYSQIKITQDLINDLRMVGDISINQLIKDIKSIRPTIDADIALIHNCNLDIILKKITTCTRFGIKNGWVALFTNESGIALSNKLRTAAIIRNAITALLFRNLTNLGVAIGNYMAIFIATPCDLDLVVEQTSP